MSLDISMYPTQRPVAFSTYIYCIRRQMLDLLCSSDGLYGNPIDIVVGTGNLGCCEIVLAVAQDNLVDQEVRQQNKL